MSNMRHKKSSLNRSGKHVFTAMVFFSGLWLCLLSSPALAAFLSALPEIPFAPNMQENPESDLIFDKAEGLIVAVEALSTQSIDDIFGFYREALPNLGWQEFAQDWQRANEVTFGRLDELLVIRVEGGVVFFKLRPKS